MVYYIDQPCIPCFPIGLVKTESDFIFRSVDTDLGRWILVVAMIIVDAYPFFGFLRTGQSSYGYKNVHFFDALCYLIIRRLNLEVVTKRLFHQQVKMPGYF